MSASPSKSPSAAPTQKPTTHAPTTGNPTIPTGSPTTASPTLLPTTASPVVTTTPNLGAGDIAGITLGAIGITIVLVAAFYRWCQTRGMKKGQGRTVPVFSVER